MLDIRVALRTVDSDESNIFISLKLFGIASWVPLSEFKDVTSYVCTSHHRLNGTNMACVVITMKSGAEVSILVPAPFAFDLLFMLCAFSPRLWKYRYSHGNCNAWKILRETGELTYSQVFSGSEDDYYMPPRCKELQIRLVLEKTPGLAVPDETVNQHSLDAYTDAWEKKCHAEWKEFKAKYPGGPGHCW